MDEWREIETAPRDGTDILLFYPPARVILSRWLHTEIYHNGVKTSEDRSWTTPFMVLSGRGSPTHWMPLPEPPSTEPK